MVASSASCAQGRWPLVSAEVVVAAEGAVRGFTLTAPLPRCVDTPHELVRPWETALYRFYDRFGDLLYVGVSWNPLRRWATHRSRSAWFDRASRVVVDVYSSEREALRVEREWIRNAKPTWNIRSRTG